jgi:hypothetical protein
MTKSLGPRAVWILGGKSQLTIVLGAQLQLEGAVVPNPIPKTMVSMMGRLSRRYNSFRVMKKTVRREK